MEVVQWRAENSCWRRSHRRTQLVSGIWLEDCTSGYILRVIMRFRYVYRSRFVRFSNGGEEAATQPHSHTLEAQPTLLLLHGERKVSFE